MEVGCKQHWLHTAEGASEAAGVSGLRNVSFTLAVFLMLA